MNLNRRTRRREQVIVLRRADAAGAVSTRFFGWRKAI
jgi:hypothetical protein